MPRRRRRLCYRVGTSGWNYPHWRSVFYPRDLPARRWFEHYARHFDTVEINNTFYHLPDEETFEAWRRQAPRGFTYAVKANRFLTHLKKLKAVDASLELFLARARLLRSRLGPVLYQLPPSWRRNAERLESFLRLLPRRPLSVFEFRDKTWFDEEIYSLLDGYRASFCAHDHGDTKCPRLAIGRAAYVRFHGTRGGYGGSYSRGALKDWADWLREQAGLGRDVYAYFNNDAEAQAVRNAVTLRELVSA